MAIIKTIMVLGLMFFGLINMAASASATQKNVWKATWAGGIIGMLEWAAAYAILIIR